MLLTHTILKPVRDKQTNKGQIMKLTTNKLKEMKAYWETMTKEEIEINFHGGVFACLCSELGTLRLLKAYRYAGDKISQGFSENTGNYYFSLETNL